MRLSRPTEGRWERRLLGYAQLAAEDALSPSLFDSVAHRLYEDYPGHVALLRYDPEGRLVGAPAACGDISATLEPYQRHYYRLNPYPAIVRARDLSNSTAIMSRYLPRTALWKTPYYNEYLRPLSVEYVIGMSMRFDDDSRISLSVYRDDHQGGEFDQTDVRRLDMLRPFLRQAVTLRRLWKEQPRQPADPVVSAEASSEPALLILQDGSVRALNAAGDRYLSLRGARLRVEDLRSNAKQGSESFRALELPGGSRLPEGSRMVIFRDDRIRRLQHLFDLTLREAEVTRELMEGASGREIAARLGITVETCRSYVKSIHTKTGFASSKRLIASLRQIL